MPKAATRARNREGAILVEMRPELRKMLEAVCQDATTEAVSFGMADMVRQLIFNEFRRRKLKVED